MNTRILTGLFAALLVAGCGSDANERDVGVAPRAVDPGGDLATEVGETPPGWNFGGSECELAGIPEGTFPLRIRLLGVENPGLSKVELDAHLKVTIDGATDPLFESDAVVDLANGGHAWLLGQGFVPDAAETVHVQIGFDDFGTSASGVIDARGLPIEFSAPAETFRFACHAVVSMFLECSLSGAPEQMVLLPQLVVRYW